MTFGNTPENVSNLVTGLLVDYPKSVYGTLKKHETQRSNSAAGSSIYKSLF